MNVYASDSERHHYSTTGPLQTSTTSCSETSSHLTTGRRHLCSSTPMISTRRLSSLIYYSTSIMARRRLELPTDCRRGHWTEDCVDEGDRAVCWVETLTYDSQTEIPLPTYTRILQLIFH